MGAHSSQQFTTLSRDRWLEILSRHVSPEIEPPIRRKSRRYGVELGIVCLLYREDGLPRARTASVLQISAGGLMIKTHKPIRPFTSVWMEVMLNGDAFTLIGEVTHSTQTVGGYKIGIQLEFPEPA
jgi:hypothetical protein